MSIDYWDGSGLQRAGAQATWPSVEYVVRTPGTVVPGRRIKSVPASLPLRLELRAVGGGVGFRSFTSKGPVPRFVVRLRGLSEILRREWPEIFEIAAKLRRGEELGASDKVWVEELSRVTGWSERDMTEDLRHIDDDPSARVERYRELFEIYFREALEFKKRGDMLQAAEKIWGAVTALVKLYAALKGVAVIHWSRGKLESFVTNNVETRHKKLFRDLLDRGRVMHEYFYEANLDPETFEERWSELVELLERAKKIVLENE